MTLNNENLAQHIWNHCSEDVVGELTKALNEKDRYWEGKLKDDSPGTPLGRLKALAEHAEKLGHEPYSSKPFELFLLEKITSLTEQLKEREVQIHILRGVRGPIDAELNQARAEISKLRLEIEVEAHASKIESKRADEFQAENARLREALSQFVRAIEYTSGVSIEFAIKEAKEALNYKVDE